MSNGGLEKTQYSQNYCFFLMLFSLISGILVFICVKRNNGVCRKLKNLPPSPPSLPLLGHLHHMFSSAGLYRSLHRLAVENGPLIYLRLGSSTLVLVSSSSVAAQIFKFQDICFASRPKLSYADKILYGAYSFINAPYGDYWRFLKKLCVNELLSSRQIDLSQFIRTQEVHKFLKRVMESAERSEEINVGVELVKFTNSVLCRMSMSMCTDMGMDQSGELRDILEQSFELAGKLYAGEMIGPFKRLVLWLYGKKIGDLTRRFDKLLETILKEHEHHENTQLYGGDGKDLMDILLEVQRDENARVKITRNNIKAFFTDLIIAGTDSSAQAMQWVIAELINHPHVLRKLRDEIAVVVGSTRLIEESDIPSLPYLQAVVKETMRLHPSAPFTTRLCRQSCKVEGYDIPENTPVAINIYTIMRDPTVWKNPDEFKPERFLNPSGEYEGDLGCAIRSDSKGNNLNFIPFGAGRRGCPGSSLAFTLMNYLIGAMVQCVDWKTDTIKVNMQPKRGMSLSMAHPLKCLPVVLFNPFDYAHN